MMQINLHFCIFLKITIFFIQKTKKSRTIKTILKKSSNKFSFFTPHPPFSQKILLPQKGQQSSKADQRRLNLRENKEIRLFFSPIDRDRPEFYGISPIYGGRIPGLS